MMAPKCIEMFIFLQEKFQILCFIDNQGPAMARNFGVNKASGEWIIFLIQMYEFQEIIF